VPAGSGGGQPVGHGDADRRPAAVVDEEVQDADGRAPLGIGQALVAGDAGVLEVVEHDLDVAPGDSASVRQQVVGELQSAMLAGVALLVGQLAEQPVEADGAQAPRPVELGADCLNRLEADLEERQLAAIADRDRPRRYQPGVTG
jgi:hypothetical protein